MDNYSCPECDDFRKREYLVPKSKHVVKLESRVCHEDACQTFELLPIDNRVQNSAPDFPWT